MIEFKSVEPESSDSNFLIVLDHLMKGGQVELNNQIYAISKDLELCVLAAKRNDETNCTEIIFIKADISVTEFIHICKFMPLGQITKIRAN